MFHFALYSSLSKLRPHAGIDIPDCRARQPRYGAVKQRKLNSKMAGPSCPEVVRGQVFDVGPRYTNLSYIGEGAYGMVW